MIYLRETFGAGETKRYTIRGRYFNLIACPSTCDVRFISAAKQRDSVAALAVVPGFWDSDPAGFAAVDVTSAGAGSVELVISEGTSGVLRIGGSVSTTITQASALSVPAAVTVNAAAVSIVSANASRRVVYFRNASAGGQTIYLSGGSGVTAGNAAIALAPGQVWADEVAAGAAWYAIASAAGGSLAYSEAT